MLFTLGLNTYKFIFLELHSINIQIGDQKKISNTRYTMIGNFIQNSWYYYIMKRLCWYLSQKASTHHTLLVYTLAGILKGQQNHTCNSTWKQQYSEVSYCTYYMSISEMNNILASKMYMFTEIMTWPVQPEEMQRNIQQRCRIFCNAHFFGEIKISTSSKNGAFTIHLCPVFTVLFLNAILLR